MIGFKKKILSQIYRGYGYKFYPKQFQKKIKYKKKYFFSIIQKKNYNNYFGTLLLASVTYKTNTKNIWRKKNFLDREDFSALHRWSWAIKIFSKNKKINNKEKIFIENSIINWCNLYSKKKIDKNDLIFEPYNISERICNYLILVKLKILKPNEFILHTLEKQFIFLLKNIEYYKYKLSNHALNNLRAIYLFSKFSKNKKLENYSIKFIIYLLKNFLDKDGFFKFGSSNYQFIFARWISDIILFSDNDKNNKLNYINNKFIKILNCLNFFKQLEKNKKISIPLFGNISPDFDNKWIIDFFLSKNKNFFSRKYWNYLRIKNKSTKIFSREWIKIQNENFTVYTRNPKIVGFDFNHSHNDFFNFVLFYKGKKIILDPGRKNYSHESLYHDISGKCHNSFLVNRKAVYDDYLFYPLLYKLGLKKEIDCNYSVYSNYNNFIILKAVEKKYTIYREIKILRKKVELNDRIEVNKVSDIKMRLNFNMVNKKLNQNNLNLKFNFYSNKKYTSTLLPSNFYQSYGSSFLGSSLVISFNKTRKALFNTIIQS